MIKEIEQNPELKSLTNRFIILDSSKINLDELRKAKQDFKIPIRKKTVSYSTELIKELLNNPNYYSNLIEVLKYDKTSYVKPCILKNGDPMVYFPMLKSQFVKIINHIISNGEIELTETIQKQIDEIKALTSTTPLKQSDEVFEITIDDNDLTFPVSKLVRFFESGYKLYDFSKNQNIVFEGLNKNELGYVLKEFASKYNLFDRFVLPDESYGFYLDLLNDTFVNTAHFNTITKTKDDFINDVILNKELVNHVLKNMPENYSKLEQAIYIYIKLCQTLTYDPEFYASNQEGKSAEFHEDISRISKITPNNSEVVCYEINQIYGKFLNMLGINYVSNVEFPFVYGKGHANLEFRINDMLIAADAVTSIIQGDLFNAKVNERIMGLTCYNKNEQVRIQYKKVLEKVHTHIVNNEPNKYLGKSGFNSWLDIYNSLTSNTQPQIKPEEKFDILKTQIKKLPLPKMENFSYLLKLSKILFNKEYENGQFDVIIGNELTKLDKVKFMPLAVLVYSPDHINANPQKNSYLTFNHNGEFNEISYNQLKQYFEVGKYDYLKQSKVRIPGIEGNKVKHD